MRNLLVSLLLILAAAISTAAQSKPPVPVADYGQWETLVTYRDYGGLSPDGKWLAYGITRSNRDSELRLTNIADGTTKTAAFGSQPAFSSDSRWVAYAIGYSEAQEEKMRKDKKPVQHKMGLLNLATGEQTVIEAIDSFAFSPDGSYLAMRRYPPEKKEAEKKDDGSPDGDETPGATLVLRQLSSGRETLFASVSEYAWQDLPKRGTLLAMTTSAEDKTGNGVQIFNTQTASVRVLDTSAAIYSGLAWRKKSADLAVLRGKTDEHREGSTEVALSWTHLGEASEAAHVYDPTADQSFPAGMRTVGFQKPAWAEDGGVVILGVAKWEEKIVEKKKSAGAEGSGSEAAAATKAKDEEEPPSVAVWNWRDVEVMPHQKLGAKRNRERNMLAAWHVEQNKFVVLGTSIYEEVTPLKHQAVAVAANWSAYAMERSIGRPAADIALVSLDSGARTKIQDRLTDDEYLHSSPGGRYLLYFHDGHYWTVNTATHAVINITKNAPTAFVNKESDWTTPQKPPFGVAGWTKDDAAVILYDKFDLWLVAPDGSSARRLTDGAAEQVRHRYEKLDPEEEFIDTSKPVYLSLFGIWTKKSGFAVLRPGEPGGIESAGARTGVSAPLMTEQHLVWLDKSVDRLAKAKEADVYEYVSQTFVESPNAFIAGPELKDPKRVTNTNPFQEKYAWSREELIEYKNSHGERLQGALFYPAGYDPAKKYPMIVYMYEKLSDNVHRYNAPSERNYYSAGAITQHGYFLLEPDIVFQPRDPGVSVVDCVTAAAKRVMQMGVVDPKRIGVMGHSWGGFDASYLATHTADFFAAAVAGAPITDLVSNYGNHHWSSGIAETDHIETGQQRMQVPLYEDLQAYIRNSAVFGVAGMTTPLLIEVGNNDGTVFYHQGVELYNIARRARKNVVLIEYAGEDHGLRKKANQIDYQRRIFAWFGHYLKDEPAAPWISQGESYLEHERELKKTKAAGTQAGEGTN